MFSIANYPKSRYKPSINGMPDLHHPDHHPQVPKCLWLWCGRPFSPWFIPHTASLSALHTASRARPSSQRDLALFCRSCASGVRPSLLALACHITHSFQHSSASRARPSTQRAFALSAVLVPLAVVRPFFLILLRSSHHSVSSTPPPAAHVRRRSVISRSQPDL
jgi:hypothetical protein